MTPQQLNAIKLGLEALEAYGKRHRATYLLGGAWDEEITLGDKAITALKEALAQPEQEPKRTGMVYYKNDACQAKDAYSHDCICWTKAQPEQVPVIDKSAAKRIATALGWTPQRKPLTDEEIEKLADDFLAYQIEDYQVSGVFTFARAIEAAHGIKENT